MVCKAPQSQVFNPQPNQAFILTQPNVNHRCSFLLALLFKDENKLLSLLFAGYFSAVAVAQ